MQFIKQFMHFLEKDKELTNCSSKTEKPMLELDKRKKIHNCNFNLTDQKRSIKNTYILSVICLLSFSWISAWAGVTNNSNSKNSSEVLPTYIYEIVNSWPHDFTAFSQGLIFKNGTLYESTGQYGLSSLRIIDLKTGKIKKKVDVPKQYFAEGITILKERIFQLTWRSHKGFIYEPNTLQLLGEFSYEGEGWGLTDDGHSLIISDGTNILRFLNPDTFKIQKIIRVHINDMPLMNLNELEYIKGEIYANIWRTDIIARIDPDSGKTLGLIDLTGLLPVDKRKNKDAVLNGIAYDQAHDRLFVTGKMWPRIFEIHLKKRNL